MPEVRESGAAFAGWSEAARERARAAGAPEPGEVEDGARLRQAGIGADMTARGAERQALAEAAEERLGQGRAGVDTEIGKPIGERALGGIPVIGEWLAGRLYGSAKNEAPDAIGGGGRVPSSHEEKTPGQ